MTDHTGPLPRIGGPARHYRDDRLAEYYDDDTDEYDGYQYDEPDDESDEPDEAARRPRGRRERMPSTHVPAHTHNHGPPPPASRKVRRIMLALLVPFVLATLVGLIVLYPTGDLPTSKYNSGTPVDGTISSVSAGDCVDVGKTPDEVEVDTGSAPKSGKTCFTLLVNLTDGPAAGSSITKVIEDSPSIPRFAAGDPIVLVLSGGDATSAGSYQVIDFQRGLPLLLLLGLFVLAVLALGRWQGARALVGLGISVVVIALFILPAILAGSNPLLVAIVGAGAIMFVSLYLTHGFSARTSVAVLGTLISLALIGLISAVFSSVARLTGLDEDTNILIGSLGHGIDARGLLLAGVVIGAMGVLDDVTVTQASAVWELHSVNSRLGWRRLYTSGVRIGRDHVAAAVNTLVLAYAGAALPLMLYSALSPVGIGSILSSQLIAQEILRTLAGSVGIIAAVPVTTALAALIVDRDDMASATKS